MSLTTDIPLHISRGVRLYIFLNIVFFCLKISFTFTNSIDPDEVHYAAFHLGLHCLQKHSLIGVSRIQSLG